MAHFVKDDHLNIFRLPAGWQYLLNRIAGGQLDPRNICKCDALVQACLKNDAVCLIDVSDYRI